MADEPEGKPPARVLCGAKTRGERAGRTCLKLPCNGSHRCHMHGGGKKNQKGSPLSGGRPSTTFRYSKMLRTDEDKELYESTRTALGDLEEEIALARTNLSRYQRLAEEKGTGGIPTSFSGGGKSVGLRIYADIIQEYLDLVGKLEERRSRILAAGKAPTTGPTGPVHWSFSPAPAVGIDDLDDGDVADLGGGDATAGG